MKWEIENWDIKTSNVIFRSFDIQLTSLLSINSAFVNLMMSETTFPFLNWDDTTSTLLLCNANL